MPHIPCFCDIVQCGGAMVASKMFDQHKQHDLSKHVQDTLASTTTACKNQDDAITTHLTSLSLFSDHSESCNPPAGSTIGPSLSGKSTEQKWVEEFLYQIHNRSVT